MTSSSKQSPSAVRSSVDGGDALQPESTPPAEPAATQPVVIPPAAMPPAAMPPTPSGRGQVLQDFIGLDDSALSPEARNRILGRFNEGHFSPGDRIITEGDPAESLYVMAAGDADVVKDSAGGQLIGRLSAGSVFGELALFTGKPRAASIVARTPVAVFSLSRTAFEELSSLHPEIAGSFLNKLYARLGQSYRELEHSEAELRKVNKMRIELASVFTNVVLVMALYTFVLGMVFSGRVAAFSGMEDYKFLLSRLVEVMALFIIVRMVRNSGQPLISFGLTLKGWKRTLLESVGISAVVMVLLVVGKAAAGQWLPGVFPSRVLLDPSNLDWTYVSYLVVAPLQEFIARCVMQGSLQRLLVGKRNALAAVLVTAFLFGALHMAISVGLAITALLTSLLWGWMYTRHNSILGVSISHFLIGNWAGLLGFWSIF
jgi:CRP-like cAMP-binding protein